MLLALVKSRVEAAVLLDPAAGSWARSASVGARQRRQGSGGKAAAAASTALMGDSWDSRVKERPESAGPRQRQASQHHLPGGKGSGGGCQCGGDAGCAWSRQQLELRCNGGHRSSVR